MARSEDPNEIFFAALMLLKTNRDLRKGGRRLQRESLGLPDWMFLETVKTWQRAHDYGLTRIREILRDPSGQVTEIIFEQVLTPAGEALLEGPLPTPHMSAEERNWLRQRLERQLATGESGGSPMIRGQGEVVGDLSDFLSPDQIRANAKHQLELLDEEDRRAADEAGGTGS